jgi:tetratricopeptide (TPR) repeat protein
VPESPGPLLWVCFGLIAIIAVVYAPVLDFGFVKYDDPQYVSANPHVFGGVTLQGISWALTSGYAANWHPLTWISHMLDIEMYGMNAGWHHLTNVLLHMASAVLLFALLYRMTGALGRSAFVAGLFAVHPIHVESVAWVAERKDVLSTFFWTLTLWAYLRYAARPELRRYLLVVVFFALALMSKPMVVTLPFILLLLDYWPLRRPIEMRLVTEKIPLFALAVASSIITFLVQERGGTVAVVGRISFAERIANALVSYGAYLGKMVWPTHLAAYYPYALSQSPWLVAGSALGLAGITLLAIWKAKDFPYFVTGWLWYLGALVPAIGIVQVGTQAMADRYTYVPMIGISIVAAWGIFDLVARWQKSGDGLMVLRGAGLAVIIACTVSARAQVKTWESSLTLWEHALAVTTDNYAAHTFLGNALSGLGKTDEAITHYEEALRIRPDYPEAHNNLGPALAGKGKIDEAITHFSEAVRLRPGYADAHNNLGVALANRGRVPEAIAHFAEAVKLDPDHAKAHYGLAVVLQNQGRTAEARQEFLEALRINPDYQDAKRGLDALTH